MLSSAALHVADRLVTALMTLVHAVAPHAVAPNAHTPTLPEAAAQSLFCRLSQLVTRLIRISVFGVRASTKPKPTPKAPNPPARVARPTRPSSLASLPRRPGWLLAALPEIGPAIAADINALLADPAIATLLNLAPSLRRTLRPILRGLGLDPPLPTPPQPPPPSTKPPGATPNAAAPPPRQPPTSVTASKLARPNTRPSHAVIDTIS